MTKVVIVGAAATFIKEPLKGISGIVVGYDSVINEVELQLDRDTHVITRAECITQEQQDNEQV